jgi:hypothetical protein
MSHGLSIEGSILLNFFLGCIFSFFAKKLDRFIVNALFSYATNTQVLQQKSENEESLVGLTLGGELYFLF